MVVSRVPEAKCRHVVVNGKELKQVNKFCYLGIIYDSLAVTELTINERID